MFCLLIHSRFVPDARHAIACAGGQTYNGRV